MVVIVTLSGIYIAVNKIKIKVEPFETTDTIIITNIFATNTNLSYIHHYMEKITKIIKDDDNIKYILRIEESPRSIIYVILKDKSKALLTFNNSESKLKKVAVAAKMLAL